MRRTAGSCDLTGRSQRVGEADRETLSQPAAGNRVVNGAAAAVPPHPGRWRATPRATPARRRGLQPGGTHPVTTTRRSGPWTRRPMGGPMWWPVQERACLHDRPPGCHAGDHAARHTPVAEHVPGAGYATGRATCTTAILPALGHWWTPRATCFTIAAIEKSGVSQGAIWTRSTLSADSPPSWWRISPSIAA